MSSLFRQKGVPIETIIREGRKVDKVTEDKLNKVVTKSANKTAKLEKKIIKSLSSRLSNKPVVKKETMTVDLKRLGF